MPTYLFAWNPNLSTWYDLVEDDRWSTGRTKDLPVGSRFFFIRLGSRPKGIVGSGFTLSEPQLGDHWDIDKVGTKYLYAYILCDFLSKDPLVTWEELQQQPFSAFNWSVRESGHIIPEPLAEQLEAIWAKRTGGKIPRSRTGTSSVTTLSEGAGKQVTVKTYERNPAARAACIAHHGSRCKVCDIDLGEKFESIASGYIHVHHRVPLSTIRKAYQINPVKDLVPVCPTCHAVLHLRVPPLSVSEARNLLKAH